MKIDNRQVPNKITTTGSCIFGLFGFDLFDSLKGFSSPYLLNSEHNLP